MAHPDLDEAAFAADAARETVLAHRGPALLVSGPAGCGKTRLAVEKVARHLTDPSLQEGQRVLCLSFSRAARARVTQALGARLQDPGALQRAEVMTFDAFCLLLARKYGDILGLSGPLRVRPQDDSPLRALEEPTDGHYAGFSEIRQMGLKLLSRNSIASACADCYPIIVVDEFQDTGRDHYRLLALLLKARAVLFAFGDPFQAIMPHRESEDASFDALCQLRSDGACAVSLCPLPGRERFHCQLLKELADGIRTHRQTPIPALRQRLARYRAKAHKSYLGTVLRRLLSRLLQSHASIAVLCRSNSRAFEVSELLALAGPKKPPAVPHVREVSSALLDRCVALGGAVWHAMVEPCDAACAAAASIIKASPCGPRSSASCVCTRYKHELSGRAADDLPVVFGACAELWAALGKKREHIGESLEQTRDDLIAQCRPTDEARTGRDVRLLLSRLVSRQLAAADYRQAMEPRGVRVMTVHQAKNRQFDAVVVVYSPWDKWFDTSAADRQAAMEEHKMLVYQAVTRAKRSLDILYPSDTTDETGLPIGPILTPLAGL